MYAPAPIPHAHMGPLLFAVLAPAPCQPPPHSPFYSLHLHLLYTLPPTHPHPFHVPATYTHSMCLPPAPIPCSCHLHPLCVSHLCHSAHLPTHTHSAYLPPAPLLFCLPAPTPL